MPCCGRRPVGKGRGQGQVADHATTSPSVSGAVGAVLEKAVDPAGIKLVSMSIRTNALVEGQGGRVALVVGFAEGDLARDGLKRRAPTRWCCPGGRRARQRRATRPSALRRRCRNWPARCRALPSAPISPAIPPTSWPRAPDPERPACRSPARTNCRRSSAARAGPDHAAQRPPHLHDRPAGGGDGRDSGRAAD